MYHKVLTVMYCTTVGNYATHIMLTVHHEVTVLLFVLLRCVDAERYCCCCCLAPLAPVAAGHYLH